MKHIQTQPNLLKQNNLRLKQCSTKWAVLGLFPHRRKCFSLYLWAFQNVKKFWIYEMKRRRFR